MAFSVKSRSARSSCTVAPRRGQIGLPGAVSGQHPPGAPGVRQGEDGSPRSAGQTLGRLARVAGDDEVEIGQRAPQEPVAHRAAHEVHVVAPRERTAGDGERVAHRARPAPASSPGRVAVASSAASCSATGSPSRW